MSEQDRQKRLFVYVSKLEMQNPTGTGYVYPFLQVHSSIQAVAGAKVKAVRNNTTFELGIDAPLVESGEFPLKFMLRASRDVDSAVLARASILLVNPGNPQQLPFFLHRRESFALRHPLERRRIGTVELSAAVGWPEHRANVGNDGAFRVASQVASWKKQVVVNSWVTRESVEKNWQTVALHYGWSPAKKAPSLSIHRDDGFTIDLGVYRAESDTLLDCGSPTKALDRMSRTFDVTPYETYAASVGPTWCRNSGLMLNERFAGYEERDFHSLPPPERKDMIPRGFGRQTQQAMFEEVHSSVLQTSFDIDDGNESVAKLEEIVSTPFWSRFSVDGHEIFEMAVDTNKNRSMVFITDADIPPRPRILRSPSLEKILESGFMLFDVDLTDDEDNLPASV